MIRSPLTGQAPRLPEVATPHLQRPTSDFPVLHAEAQVPEPGWDVVVDGLVATPLTCSVAAIRGMVCEARNWDLHCVQGWSKLECRWEGIPAVRLIDAAHPLAEARFVMATAVGNGYTSCLALNRVRRSLLAWRLDGAALTPDHGGPLRLVPPPTKWGYKGVKWISRLTLTGAFSPGPLEGGREDPHGDIPHEVLHHIETLVQRRLY